MTRIKQKIPCAFYARTSSLGNVDRPGFVKDTFTRQEQLARAFAERNYMDIVITEYDAGVKGTLPIEQRHNFKKLLVACLERNVDTILIEDASRFGRDADVCLYGLLALKDKWYINHMYETVSDYDLIGAWRGETIFEKLVPFIKFCIAQDVLKTLCRIMRSGREKLRILVGKCEGRKGMFEVYGLEFIDEIVRMREVEGLTFRQITTQMKSKGIPAHLSSIHKYYIKRNKYRDILIKQKEYSDGKHASKDKGAGRRSILAP